MLSFDELYDENHKISELSNVLSRLIEDRLLCDTSITSKLFFKYIDHVKHHLDIEEREMYQPLLISSDSKIKNIANQFLSGSGEIKRVLKQYTKRWCRGKKLWIKNHDLFIQESRDIFTLVSARILNETERLYPLVRNLDTSSSTNKKAA